MFLDLDDYTEYKVFDVHIFIQFMYMRWLSFRFNFAIIYIFVGAFRTQHY